MDESRFDPSNCEVHALTTLGPMEAPLADLVKALLRETESDPVGFHALRDVCLQTLQPNALASSCGMHHHLPATSSAIANATHASEESSVIQSQKSPLTSKTKQHYNLWKSSKTKDGIETTEDTLTTPQAPITDLVVVFSGDIIPEDFEKIEKSPSGIKADFNRGRRGQFVYLCLKRDASALSIGSKRPPISEIMLIYPEKGEVLPPNYEYVLRRGVPANLNAGAASEKLYMCYKRSSTTFLTDIALIFPKKGEKMPYGYMKIDKSPTGLPLSESNGSMDVSICYKKQLGSVETLRNMWWKATIVDAAAKPKDKEPLPSDMAASKSTEIRTESLTANESHDNMQYSATILSSPVSKTKEEPEAAMDHDTLMLIKYVYPALYACHMRHGTVAMCALKIVDMFLTNELVQTNMLTSDAMLLSVITETINTSCQQGIKERLPMSLAILSKMIKHYAHGFTPGVLHECLKALLFMNDFDDESAKTTLEDLIHFVMGRIPDQGSQLNHLPEDNFLTNIVYSLADEAVTSVEIARVNEIALNISKGHSSIYSTGYYQELQACIKPFLGSIGECIAYQLIATLSKYAIKRNCTAMDQAFELECHSMRNTIRLLDAALLSAPKGFKERLFFGQQIRRFVFSVVNSAFVVWSEQVFGACLSLVSTLWNHYRRHLKIELALLFENVFLRILRSPTSVASKYQIRVLQELTPWFQLPHNVIEIFLNFDMDRQFVQQWKVFEQFCAVLCSITEASCVNTGDTEEHDSTMGEHALTTILAILRSLMDASGHANLMLSNDRTRIMSMAKGGWELDESSEPAEEAPTLNEDPPPLISRKSNSSDKPKDNKVGSIYGGSVRERNEMQKKSQQLLKRGMEIAETKSFKKALEYLIAMGLIKETPRDITSFLRIYHTFFNEGDIGDYLGEGDEEFKLHVRLTYARAISFTGMTLVEALRHYLTNGGFKLPGEAQKIARMVEAFAQCYYDDSAPHSTFSSSDTIMILAYSIIMLNTDLHNPQVKKNKMSKDQFVKNNRGIDNGNDVPKSILEDIYDDILSNPIQLKGLAYTMTKQDRTSKNADAEVEKYHITLSKSVTQSEDLMKDLAMSKYTFNFFGVDASISPDLVKVLFERVWFHFLALTTTILSNNQSDVEIVLHCLDILRYCMSTCLFLEMPVERQAFSNQLTKVKSSNFVKTIPGERSSLATPSSSNAMEDDWLTTIDRDSATADPWKVIGDIHVYVNKLKESIEKRKTVETLTSVIKRINHSQAYLHDTTHFIREGDLTKRCRTGRNRLYRFFLFNDQLLYADKSSISGNWNAHQSLRLRLTRLADIPDSIMLRNAFQILNPVKTFTVIAESAAVKAEWMRAIEEAITEANKKTNRIARRLSHHHGKKRSGDNNNLIAEAAKADTSPPPVAIPTDVKASMDQAETSHQLWLFQVQV